MRLLAQTLFGLESVLAAELKALGASQIQLSTGEIEFEGDKRMLYRSNLELRTAIRILYPIATFRAQADQHLYEGIRQIDWARYLDEEGSFAVDAVCNSEYFVKNSSAALRCRDAVTDLFEERYGVKPGIDTKQPSIRINLSIVGDQVRVALDSSSDPLNIRGYEHQALDASLHEVLAAGMILLSGWQGERDFVDPMCGSGTLLIEAAMIAYRIPPMMHREYFGFKKWSNFDKALWEQVQQEAKKNIKKQIDCEISGFDSAFQALRVSERNLQSAGLQGKIAVERLSIEKQKLKTKPATIITSPPGGEGVDAEDLRELFKQLGDMLRKKCKGSEAWIITGMDEDLKSTSLKISSQITLNNGYADCKFVQFEQL
ncbi:MAG: THUMP domain-containing class I SAM-dependent RNA methyltransferase [Saprospiraceae bacterium]